MATQIDVGVRPPDFDLPATSGKTVRLSALKGQKIVLYFYPKDDTTGCTAEAIAFNGLKEKFRQARTQIIGVSPDSLASHVKFARKHKLDLELASDESKAVLQPLQSGGSKITGRTRPTVTGTRTASLVANRARQSGGPGMMVARRTSRRAAR